MSAIVLTPMGKQAAENTANTSGPEYAVLSILYEANGPVDMDEIMEGTHMDDVKASMVVNSMINKGLVKEI